MATESEVRKLKKGDCIRYFSDNKITVIETIIFDNIEDLKNRHGDRCTINGLHWSFVDIEIIPINLRTCSLDIFCGHRFYPKDGSGFVPYPKDKSDDMEVTITSVGGFEGIPIKKQESGEITLMVTDLSLEEITWKKVQN